MNSGVVLSSSIAHRSMTACSVAGRLGCPALEALMDLGAGPVSLGQMSCWAVSVDRFHDLHSLSESLQSSSAHFDLPRDHLYFLPGSRLFCQH